MFSDELRNKVGIYMSYHEDVKARKEIAGVDNEVEYVC